MIPRQTPVRARIYVRTATVGQDDREDQLEAQVIACRRLAESMNADVVAEYRDLGSGTSRNRSGLQAMLDAAQQHHIDVVLCERPDRLARGVVKLFEFEQNLGRLGVPVHHVTGDPPGRFALAATLASLEAPMRATRDEEA
jgi:DNA invertase Pin-like site-specific DNA recombinase